MAARRKPTAAAVCAGAPGHSAHSESYPASQCRYPQYSYQHRGALPHCAFAFRRSVSTSALLQTHGITNLRTPILSRSTYTRHKVYFAIRATL